MGRRRLDAAGWALALLLVILACAAWPESGRAQPVRPEPAWEREGDASHAFEAPATTEYNLLSSAGRAFLMSAIVPGAGQWSLGSERWVPYLALEVWALVTYFDHRSHARHLERQYRDLAWSVARRVSIGVRQDGDWDYYEAIGKYHASGVLDADPRASGLQPERDITTYNGAMWSLARAIHIPAGTDPPESSPEYQEALSYYQGRAIAPELAWSWGDNGLEQQVFRELVRDSDEAYRAATRVLGVVLANHIISAIDALITSRLRAPVPARVDIELRGGRSHDVGNPARWRATLRVPLP